MGGGGQTGSEGGAVALTPHCLTAPLPQLGCTKGLRRHLPAWQTWLWTSPWGWSLSLWQALSRREAVAGCP